MTTPIFTGLPAAIDMCRNSLDIYSLIEILRMAREDGFELKERDWENVIRTAWRCRRSQALSPESFDTAFREVLDFLQSSGSSLTQKSTYLLLRFLAESQGEGKLLDKLTRNLREDEAISVRHSEVAILTHLMLKQRQLRVHKGVFALQTPMFECEDYLKHSPGAAKFVYDTMCAWSHVISGSFVEEFDTHWRRMRSARGRRDMFDLLMCTISDPGQRFALVHANGSQSASRRAFILLSVYTAHSLAVSDLNFRAAYNLLYDTKLLLDDAESFKSNSGARNVSHTSQS